MPVIATVDLCPDQKDNQEQDDELSGINPATYQVDRHHEIS